MHLADKREWCYVDVPIGRYIGEHDGDLDVARQQRLTTVEQGRVCVSIVASVRLKRRTAYFDFLWGQLDQPTFLVCKGVAEIQVELETLDWVTRADIQDDIHQLVLHADVDNATGH